MKFVLVALTVCVACAGLSQKKPIDHTVYDDWKEIEGEKISNNGEYVTYAINPQVGDGWLFLQQTNTLKKDSIHRGKRAVFGPESNYLAGLIDPGHDTLRSLKLAGKKPNELPKDSGFIWLTSSDSLIKFPNVKAFNIPEEGKNLVIRSEESSWEQEKTKKKCRLFGKNKQHDSIKKTTDGKDLVVFNSETFKSDTIQRVVDFDLSEDGEWLVFVSHMKTDTVDSFSIELMQLQTMERKFLGSAKEDLTKAKVSYHGNYVAYLASEDTSKNKMYSLAFFKNGEGSGAKIVVDSIDQKLPEGWTVSGNGSIRFRENEALFVFGIAPRPYNKPKDTLLESEKYNVDIWHWQDEMLQPEQLRRQSFDRKKTYDAIFFTEKGTWVQIEDEELEDVGISTKDEHLYAIGEDDAPYRKSYSWAMPWLADYYLVDLTNGERTLLFEGVGSGPNLSPITGKHAAFFSQPDSAWLVLNLNGFTQHWSHREDFSDEISRDINGQPHLPGSYGQVGWTDNEEHAIVNSEYHVWLLGTKREKPECLTCKGKKGVRYRLMRLDPDEKTVSLNEDLLFVTYNEETKGRGFAVLKKGSDTPTTIFDAAMNLRGFAKAEEAEAYIFRPMDFRRYPDLWYAMDLSEPTQLTHANPQQSEYKWGNVELIKWTSYEGRELEGLLYTPEDIDTTKKYPMIVYFYELYDDMMHNHYVPKPTASIVYPTEYVSNDYVVFIPNIEYKPGHPGKSAYDCIMSGTDYVLDKYMFVDSTRMGLQGQSWGGYQTAYLVTQTDRYAAAMAGAPVSNMTSAYGGIRWGSGMSRMFQYERTQSRIGVTLWDSLDLYIENSPVFFAPKVKTPLLIMHNDEDGAVPWYQGIEYFVALRRLEKPVWMLNYNGDKHNLMKRPNRVDLSIRMRQFFDYYLQDEPAPIWLQDGLPAVDKGRKTGYELTD